MNPKNKVYENKKYEAFIRKKSCIICGNNQVQLHHTWHARRNVYSGIPLCVEHHMPGFPGSYHQVEKNKFEEIHSVCLEWEIINLLSEFIQESK
jgi:hypothetical protein